MRAFSKNKYIAFLRLFKYVSFKNSIFYLKQKLLGNHFVPITFKDGTHREALTAQFLNILPFRLSRLPGQEGFFFWKLQNRLWVANYEQIYGLSEYVNGEIHKMYSASYENRIVLDIGGFIGDTARFFIEEGAKKVIIFEPVGKNIQALSINLKDHDDSVEIHQKALSHSDKEEYLFSCSPEGSSNFGVEKGTHKMICQGIKIETILAKNQIDIAKVDCEGGEKYLLDADNKTLQKVNYWIIETHDMEIYKNIIHKFCKCGFVKLKQFYVAPGVYVIHFSKEL